MTLFCRSLFKFIQESSVVKLTSVRNDNNKHSESPISIFLGGGRRATYFTKCNCFGTDFCEIDVLVGTIWEVESFLFLFSSLFATVSSASFPFLDSFSLFSAAFVTSEFSGIVEGLQDDLVLEDDADLAPADIGPVVDDRAFVSTLSADFALATIPLLNDDFTWNGKTFYTSSIWERIKILRLKIISLGILSFST